MTRTPERTYGPAQLGNSDGQLYSASGAHLLKWLRLSNPTGGAVTVTLSIGADGVTTRILDAYSIAAGAVKDFWLYINLANGETIRGHASAASSVVIVLGGDAIT